MLSVLKYLGVTVQIFPIFQEIPQYTQITAINMHLLIEISPYIP